MIFDYGSFEKICDKIKYLVIEKGGITESIEIRIDSYDPLLTEKTMLHSLNQFLVRIGITTNIKYF